MGTPVPEDPPVLVDELWYIVTVDVFEDDPPFGDCDQEYQGPIKCCGTGFQIRTFQGTVIECRTPFEFCWFSGGSAQRIVSYYGPFPDEETCQANL